MDLKFLQHRLNQLRDRDDIAFSPPHLPELVSELVEFEDRGFDFEHGLVVLDRSGKVRMKDKCPVVLHAGEHLHDGDEFLNPFFYKKDEILVTGWAREKVEEYLGRNGAPCEASFDAGSDEPVVLKVEDAGDLIPRILENIADRRVDRMGREILPASYNYLFFASPVDCGSPAGDPRQTCDRPPLGAPGAGRDVRVAVLDTGILPDYADNPALADDVEFDPDRDIDPTYSRGYIHFPGCHGTFAAGVVRRVAPACTIIAIRVLDRLGVGSEADVAEGIRRAIEKGAHIINLSLTCPGAPENVSPIFLEPALTDAVGAEIALIGAAGNAGRPEPTWPGHLREVVGVGAVDVNGQRAHFSNYGPAIDVWARGEDVVNAFGTGPYRPMRGGPTLNFEGYAVWSGTSFATPLVSGLVAARSATDSTKPPVALEAVLEDTARSLALGPGPDGQGARLVTLDTTVGYPPALPPAPPPGPGFPTP